MESNGINVALIEDQLAYINLTLETEDEFETYGGTMRGQFEFQQTGVASWRILIREAEAVSAPLRMFTIYAREKKTGREWVVLKGKIIVSARTAAVPADKLAPVEYFVTVPVVDHDVDAVGSTIVQGIPGPQEEPSEPEDVEITIPEPEVEEYTPLPVWPIVEPEDLPPHVEVENS